VAGGTIMGGTTATAGRAAGSDEPIRPFEGKSRHFFLKILFFTLGARDGFSGPKDDGFKILTAIQAGIFKDRHFLFS
jgi:hypothetical protein